MNNLYSKRSFLIPFLLGGAGLLTILLSEVIVLIQGTKIVQVSWLASVLVTASTIVIYFYSVDIKSFDEIIKSTNPIEYVHLPSMRYLHWLVISMVIGLLATITIAFDFIVGMLVYLVMQICLIIAFSGIYSFRPSLLLAHSQLRRTFLTSSVFWGILVPLIYFTLVFNGVESLIVVPYVIALGSMAWISWFGFGYSQRSTAFRCMIILASGLFVFSDTLIGNSRYGLFKLGFNVLIDITYVFNIFLMSHAILFLRDASGRTVLRS